MKLAWWIFAVIWVCCACASAADVITFETAPNGSVHVDDALLSSPYNITGGTVRFFYDINGNNNYDSGIDVFPAFEAAGKDAVNAFASAWDDSADTPRPGYAAELGNYFLRTAGSGNPASLPPPPPGPFIAQCITSGTITAFSGELWDIDGGSNGGTEQWRVEVLDGSGKVLATELSPLGVDDSANSLDSLPWVFSFDNLLPSAESVRLTFIGTKTNGIGFAFNNFSVTVVPEPSSLVLLALACLGLIPLCDKHASG
jgi:hypothetical protein